MGQTRELDVFSIELLSPVEKASEREGLAELRRILEKLRGEAWDETVALVRSEDFTGFALDLAIAAETRIWREHAAPEHLSDLLRPARELAGETLGRGAAKKPANAPSIWRSLSTAKRHRLRIALKKLRYSAEFFAPLFAPKPVANFLERLSKLQDLFGALNDAATTETILRRVLERAGERTLALSEAAAFVDGWHQRLRRPDLEQGEKTVEELRQDRSVLEVLERNRRHHRHMVRRPLPAAGGT